MTNIKAAKILECMAVDLTGSMAGLSPDSPMVDVLSQELEAINVAQDFLRPSAENRGHCPFRGTGTRIIRLIDANEVLENLDAIRGCGPTDWDEAIGEAMKRVAKAATIDPESLRPVGRWKCCDR